MCVYAARKKTVSFVSLLRGFSYRFQERDSPLRRHSNEHVTCPRITIFSPLVGGADAILRNDNLKRIQRDWGGEGSDANVVKRDYEIFLRGEYCCESLIFRAFEIG